MTAAARSALYVSLPWRGAAGHRRRRASSAGAAASAPGDDVAWLGSRFAAGAEQRSQELRMVALKERLASDSAAEYAGASLRWSNAPIQSHSPRARAIAFALKLDALAAEERDRAAEAASRQGRDSLAAQVRHACEVLQLSLVERETEARCFVS